MFSHQKFQIEEGGSPIWMKPKNKFFIQTYSAFPPLWFKPTQIPLVEAQMKTIVFQVRIFFYLEVLVIPDICSFWYTATLSRPVKCTPKSA